MILIIMYVYIYIYICIYIYTYICRGRRLASLICRRLLSYQGVILRVRVPFARRFCIVVSGVSSYLLLVARRGWVRVPFVCLLSESPGTISRRSMATLTCGGRARAPVWRALCLRLCPSLCLSLCLSLGLSLGLSLCLSLCSLHLSASLPFEESQNN